MRTGSAFRLFVYGTLKRGFPAHERLCGCSSGATAAFISAQLYDQPEGYPAIVAYERCVLARGSADLVLDLHIQEETEFSAAEMPTSGNRVYGEVLHFSEPQDVTAIDEYEGFVPGGSTFYERVLVPAVTADGAVTSWAYTAHEARGRHLPGGVWPENDEAGTGA